MRRLDGPRRRAGRSPIGRLPFAMLGGGARLLVAAVLGVGAAVLVSCGSSGAGLIPSQNAGPLLSDFRAVERSALTGDGDCAPTKAALSTTERDFQALPASVDVGLHGRLQEGISNLRKRALEMCSEPLAQTTTTGESTSTTTTTAPSPSTTTTKTQATTTPTGTSPTTSTTTGTGAVPTTPQPSGPGGGTPAPGVGGSSEGQGQPEEGAAPNAQEGSGGSGGTGSSGGGGQ
jgi:hypothetical protein